MGANPAEVQRISQIFDAIDRDGDGAVTPAELDAAMKSGVLSSVGLPASAVSPANAAGSAPVLSIFPPGPDGAVPAPGTPSATMAPPVSFQPAPQPSMTPGFPSVGASMQPFASQAPVVTFPPGPDGAVPAPGTPSATMAPPVSFQPAPQPSMPPGPPSVDASMQPFASQAPVATPFQTLPQAPEQLSAAPPLYAAPPSAPVVPAAQPCAFPGADMSAQRASELFDSLDRDGDGQLSREEVAEAMASGAIRPADGVPPPMASMPAPGMAAPTSAMSMVQPPPAFNASPPASMVAPQTASLQQPQADQLERLSQLFDAIDRNGDGKVSRPELDAAMASGVITPPAAPPATTGLPVGQPGASLQQPAPSPVPLMSFQPAPPGADNDAMRRASDLFDSLDRNGDGFLSRQELEQAMNAGVVLPGAGPPPQMAASMPVMERAAPPMSMPPPGGAAAMTMPPPTAASPLMSMPAGAMAAPPMSMAGASQSYAPANVPDLVARFEAMTPGMPAPAPMQPGQMSMQTGMPAEASMQPGQMSMQTGMPPGTLQPSLQAGQPAGGQVNFAPAPMSQANAKQMSGQGETGSLVNGRKKYEFPMKPNEFIDVFPTLFTIFIMALFIIPIWLTYSVGRDGQVRYWIGSYCSTVLLLPICYLILHVVHLYQARPSKPGMIICLLGSCFLLLLVADYTLLEAYGLGNLLMSKDCVSFEHKRVLQEEWLSAKAFYNSCMQATAAKSGITFDAAVSLYRIEDCLEYENLKASYPDWEYFAKLEETYSCSGWCTHDQPLWTFKAVKDSCSQVVADVMFNKVEWGMTQVVVYTILALGFTAVFLLAAGPIFQSTGISW